MIAVSSWMQAQPSPSVGLLVNYGSQALIEDQAWYRGYDLGLYPERCGVSLISPAHLGRIVWLRTGGGWFGPCLVVDAMAQGHFWRGVYVNHEIAEVPRWLAARLGFENGALGEAWIGACPPAPGAVSALPYSPPLAWAQAGERRPSFWPLAEQELPGECPAGLWN